MKLTFSSVLASLKKFLEEEFECSICLETCIDTLVNPECNHRFCGKCIKESLNKCNHECPTCRVPIPTYRTCRRDAQFDRILDRLVKEFIVPLEKHINSEQEEKQVVEKEKETQEIVGQKRRARTIDTNSGESSTSASKEMVAVGETRRSKRVKAVVKVAPTYYVPVEEESLEARVVIRNTTLTTDTPRPLDHSSATDETIEMNVSNEDTNIGSSRRVSAVAAATMVDKRRKEWKTFDARFKDLMAFKAEFGHCNVPKTKSSNNKYLSLGKWCGNMRWSYKAIKEGGIPRNYKLSKADMKRLENAGFEWNLYKTFDERLKDLTAFKAEFGHCNVPQTFSSNNKYHSLGQWCGNVRRSYKAIKEGRNQGHKFSKADMKRLENAGFVWGFGRKTRHKLLMSA